MFQINVPTQVLFDRFLTIILYPDRQTVGSAKPIETIDGTTLTELNNNDDLLTIASECLTYRNFEADTSDFVFPLAVAPNVATGWILAAVF